jgi:hypothetical protein
MKLFRRKQKTQAPGTRQVVRGDRPSAFSYHANRSDQEFAMGRQQPRDQDVRRRERLVRYWRQRLGMFVAGVVLIVCVLYTLHLNNNAKVVSLAPASSGYFLQSTDVYQRAASKDFASSIFNSNKVTINAVGIEQKLQQQFPELSEVSVAIPLMSHRPIIYIAPTTPSLILTTGNGSFVLDNTGKALIGADAIAGLSKLNLPTVTDQSGLQVHSGTIALASSEVSFVRTVMAELQAKGVTVQALTLPNAAYELDVHPSGVGYFVKFNMHTATARQQAGTYLAVKSRLGAQGITPASYVDVRLDGRAYYK